MLKLKIQYFGDLMRRADSFEKTLMLGKIEGRRGEGDDRGNCRQNAFQFSSVALSCLTLFDPMNCSMPGLPVHHQLPESTQTHIH